KAGAAKVFEEGTCLTGHLDGVREVGARLGSQVEAQFVGMVDVGRTDWPRMEGQRAGGGGPGDDGELSRSDLVGVAPARNRDLGRPYPVRRRRRRSLLIEGVPAVVLAGGQARPLEES